MNVSLNWLKYYIDIELSPQELADKMTLAGIAVEGITYLGQGIDGVVTGKVTEIKKHPEADKLFICTIDVAQGEPLTIVTGADNVTQGAVVPVAVVGSTLPGGMKMKKAKLRGVDSYGMLCSATELNLDSKTLLPAQREGIFILDADTPIGVDIKEVLGLNDVILEFELTANRADCFGMVGIAREVAGVTGAKLKNIPTLPQDFTTIAKSDNLNIQIEDASLSGRFSGKILRGLKVQPSPAWMQNCLRAVGMRPINNIVDVTNFVMLELCQPMHAYDYATLQDKTIIVRRATAGEQLITLDSIKRDLTGDMIVIANSTQPIGLAGVMGGFDTEVTDNTVDIMLEAAQFNPAMTRRTSRALGLRSEASGRFERGTDIESTVLAIERATQLLCDISGVASSEIVVDCYPNPKQPLTLSVTAAEVNKRLGTSVGADKMQQILVGLGFTVEVTADTLTIGVPSWRMDVTDMVDITEEIARSIGFDNIPSTLPKGDVMQAKEALSGQVSEDVRNYMIGAGLDEVVTYSFIHPTCFDKLNISADSKLRNTIPLANPITEDFKVLRTTLIDSILQTVKYNLSRRNDNIAIFELANTYIADSLPLVDLPTEELTLVGAMCGRRDPIAWNTGKENVDFYDVKALVVEMLECFGLTDITLKASELTTLHPGKSADVYCNDVFVGSFGELHPIVVANYDLNCNVYIFELKLTEFCKAHGMIAKYKSLPKYPFINRDLSMLVPDNIIMKDLQALVCQSAGEYLTDFKLFDVYQGKQIKEGYKSIAFTLTFQAQDRTLTDKEVEEFTANVVNNIQEKFNLQLRA